MNLEPLIPILMFFIVFGIFVKRLRDYRKQERKKTLISKPKKEVSPKKISWKDILGEIVGQIRQQMETRKIPDKKDSPWDQLLKPGTGPTGSETGWVGKTEREIPQPPPRPKPELPSRIDTETLRNKEPAASRDTPSGEEETGAPARKRPERSIQLSDAVIWSEILGRPVALRQEGDDHARW
jgi:hypothetical protein